MAGWSVFGYVGATFSRNALLIRTTGLRILIETMIADGCTQERNNQQNKQNNNETA
jgi:coenzyme F420-reducing hydrogenase beta subunit